MPRLLSPEEFEEKFGNSVVTDALPRAGLGTAFGAAVDRAQGSLYGIGEAVGLPLGGLRRANQFEADESERRFARDNPLTPQSFRDIETVGDAGRYVAKLGVQSAPYLAGIAAGGLAGGPLGAFAVGSTFGTGDVLDNQRESAGRTNLLTAVPLGAAYGAVDALTGLGGAVARRSLGTGIRALDDAGSAALNRMTGFGGYAARGTVSAGKSALTEGVGETLQEGFNQLGRMSVNTNEELFSPDALDRYAESFVGGAALGGVFGGATGMGRRRSLEQGNFDLTGQGNPTPPTVAETQQQQYNLVTQFDPLQDRINQQLGITRTPSKDYEKQLAAMFGEPSGQFVQDPQTGVERELSVGELYDLRSGVVNTQQSAAPAPAPAAQQVQADIQLASQALGVTPVQTPTNLPTFDVLGARIYGQESLNKMLAEWSVAQQAKTPGQQELTQGLINSGLVTLSGTASAPSAKRVESAVSNLAKRFQLTEAQNPAQAANILNDQIATLVAAGKNEGDVKLGQMATLYESLTGTPPPALATKATNQGVVNKQQQGQANVSAPVPSGQPVSGSVGGGSPVVQGRVAPAGSVAPQSGGVGGNTAGLGTANAAVSTVPATSGKPAAPVAPSATPAAPGAAVADNGQLEDGYANDSEAWEDFAPQGAMRYEQLAAGYKSLWNEARRRGRMTGELAEQIALEAQNDNDTTAQQGDESLRGTLTEALGERDAGVIYDVIFNGATHTEAATNYGLSQGRVGQLAGSGDVGALARGKLIDKAAKRLGWSPEYTSALKTQLNEAATQAKRGMTAADIDARTVSMDDAFAEDGDTNAPETNEPITSDQSFGAGELDTGNQTFAEAGLSTISSAGGSTGFTDLMSEKNEAKANPRDLAASLTERWQQVQEQIADLQAKLDASPTRTVATANKKLTEAEVEAKIAELQKKADEFIKRITDALNRATPTITEDTAVDEEVDTEQDVAPADMVDELTRQPGEEMPEAAAADTKPAAPKKAATKTTAPKQDSGQTLWEKLRGQMPDLAPYEDLDATERGYLTELADRTKGKPVLAKELGLQELVKKFSGERKPAQAQLQKEVEALPEQQAALLEKTYGAKRDSKEFLARLVEDVVNYTNKAVEKVDAAIRGIIKSIAEGVLAMGIVLNPTAFQKDFAFNLPATYQKAVQVGEREMRAEVPANAAAKMSATAKGVYESMAPVAKKSGKGFMIADKPNGMLHVFNADGSLLAQEGALYGKDTGDTLGKSSLQGGPKVTPSGKYTLGFAKSEDYTGGAVFRLLESEDETGFVAVHAVYVGNPKENRVKRFYSPKAEDKRVSYGCINTTNEMFLNKLLPSADQLNGGMIFVLPDSNVRLAEFAPTTEPVMGSVTERTDGASGTDTREQQPGLPKNERAAKRSGSPSRQKFGKDNNTSKAKNPYTAKELLAELTNFVRADIPGRKLMVVDTIDDLLTHPDDRIKAVGAEIRLAGAYGVAVDGRAFLVADRIEKGAGRAKFMHEVGSHLGLENLLPSAVYNKLVDQIEKWAQSDANTDEVTLANRALLRVLNAGTPKIDQREELLAYFLEEAVEAGIDPTSAGKASGPLREWFRTLWAAFKVAVRKLGFKPEALTAQDVVNLAFGAARLEIAGTWHGTAASFRNFSNKFMGTGEGAQAFGWGTYLAQRAGIAKGYWQADTARKTKGGALYMLNGAPVTDPPLIRDLLAAARSGELNLEKLKTLKRNYQDLIAKYKDEPRFQSDARRLEYTLTELEDAIQAGGVEYRPRVGPEGSLMRVDTAVAENELLDWNTPLSEQPEVLKRVEAALPDSLREAIEEETNLSLDEMTGEDLYNALKFVEDRDSLVSEQFSDVEDYNRRLSNAGSKQVVSTYMDEQLGVPGIKFFDANSRGNASSPKTRNLVIFNDKNIFRVGSETAANPERMKFGRGPRFEGLPNANDPAIDTPVKQRQTKIDRAIRLMDRAEKAKDPEQAAQLRAEAEALLADAARGLAAGDKRMKFGKNAVPTQSVIQKNIAALPKQAQQPVRNILGALGDVAGKGLDYVVFTGDLVNRAVQAGLASAKKFERLLAESKAAAREMEREVERVADLYAVVPDVNRGTGERSVNRFLFDSTREGKWGFTADWRDDPVKADPEMERRFNALEPEAQAFVKAVFQHGDKMLASKKKTVLDATTSEYDALIAQADADNDTKLAASLRAEKAATLKRFQSLFKIREGIPYAPIKRDGKWVVLAKSQEYRDAEANNDQKKLRELESNGDHYNVTFVDSKWEARTLQSQLKEQGFFGGDEAVQIAERDTMTDELYGGTSSLRELTKLRAKVDAQVADGDKDPTSQRMLRIISQMYLEALAEGSARKSEMRRRGVDGEVDMLASFTRQGRADANFLSAVQFNPQVQDALQEMRKQAKTGDRTRKSELLNELVRRHLQSMDYQPQPWVNKLSRLSSIYFLVTSPAYYLQNLTQPWMMSLPAMSGRHDYTTSSAALFKAYGELKDVMASAKLFSQQFDFDKVPADVRAAVKELANRGKIDIGLDSELGEFTIGGDGAIRDRFNRIDKGMRLAVQKVESINRLSTAMAAYRLELAKTGSKEKALDYADRILTETHGDYTAFNAPRIFNTNFGKIALQFRKFQLIQLAFYAKLIKDAYQGRDRKAALKTLAFSLAHTGVLAGVTGLPGFAAIAWALGSLLGDDDEKYDVSGEIRKAIGDETIANMVLRGVPTLGGADISGKVGAGNMLSILPFSNADLTTRAGQIEAVGTLIGGATLGMTVRMADGLGLMLSGDFYKGLELTVPKGVGDALKAYRIATEGMTRRNGDVLLPPDQVDSLGSIFQALGIPSVQQQVVYERQQRTRDMDQRFQDRSTRIKNDYVKASREGDTEAMSEAREAWAKLQEARKRNGYTVQPMSNLLRAPQEQRKREQNTAGGVQFNKANRRAVEEQAEI